MDDEDVMRERVRRFGRIALAGLLGLLGLWIAAAFLPALIWAVVIAVAIDPLRQRAVTRWPGPHARTWLAAIGTTALALLVLIPLILSIAEAAREARDVSTWIALAQTQGLPVPDWVAHLPVGSRALAAWWQENLTTPEAATQQLQHLRSAEWLTRTQLIGTNVLHRAVIFGFTLLTLFFLLRDRDSILAQCRHAGDRMLGPAGERIALLAALSIRGTIDGLVLVGIGEGAVMAVVYLVLGVPHALLFGAVTAVAAMIPFGAALVFAVTALLLLAKSAVAGAIAVVVIGLVVVAIADHFIRPILIGGATRLPFLWVLIGILGGVETLGLLGLFVGPATMAVLIMLWRDFVGEPVVAGR
ncbi:AI-2E family transporter [soil metagenome]